MFGDQSDGDAQQETSAKSESHAAADDQTVIVAATWGAANDQVDAQQETRASSESHAAADDQTVIVAATWGAANDQVDAQQETRARSESHAAADDQTVVLAPLTWGAANDQVLVGNIPRLPPGFQPRPDLLAELTRAAAGVSVVHATTWAPGVGKTQLAAAYARAKRAAGWRLVAWIDAQNAKSLLAGLAVVADAAGLRNGSSWRDTAEAGLAVRDRLEADGDRCLIVFDNASDPDVLRPFVPTTGAARVLITSNQQSMADLGTSVKVNVFTPEEALAFLAGRIGLADDSEAAPVAAELRYLPLALAQAAATIAGEHLACGTYLERLRELAARQYLIQGQGQPYPYGVAEAVLLSLDAVRAGNQGGLCAGVMELMAVLSATGVPRDLLHAAGRAGVLVRRWHRSRVSAPAVDGALVQLADRSLLTFTVDGQVVIAHRLVRQVVRDGLVRRGRLAAAYRAAAFVLDTRAGVLDGAPDRMAARDILEQVTALVENATGPAAEADDELARIMLPLRLWALYHLDELGDNAPQAVAAGEPLAADFERILGPDHPDTLGSRNNLAAAYQAAGRVGAAIPLFEQVLAARERLLGPDHPDTLGARNNLAAAYQAAGRVGAAIPLFEQVLAARERLLGPDRLSTVNSRGNLAAAYQAAGRVGAAIPLFEQVLAARERLLGPDHPDTLGARDDLAAAYQAAGRLDAAIPLFKRALAARERLLGSRHPETLGALNNLAAAHREAGRVTEAIPLFEEVLAARERLLGRDHADTLGSRDDLANAYQEAGRPDEAIPLFEQTLATRERVFGTDHPDTVVTRNSLTLACQKAGRAEE